MRVLRSAAVVRLGLVLCFTVGIGCAAALPPPRPPIPRPPPLPAQTMRMHVIDVGQGDAILLEFPCAAALVDTGGEKNTLFDSTGALLAYLDAFFERRTDLARTLKLLVISHPHIDHTRGIPALLERYKVENVVDNGEESSSGQDQVRALHAAIKERGLKHHAVQLAEIPPRGLLSNGIIDPIACKDVDPRLRVAWGSVAEDPGWGKGRFGKRPFDNQNNHSVVVRVDFGKASALLTGDLEEQAIGALVARYRGSGLLDVDVYKVGHHGSWNGTTEDLLAAMTPQVAVISSGAPERRLAWTAWKFGHPRASTVDLLRRFVRRPREPIKALVADGVEDFAERDLDVAVYGTPWDGTVIVELSSDGKIEVRTGRQAGKVEKAAQAAPSS